MKNKIFAIAFFCLVCVQHQVKGQFVGTPYIVPVTDVYSETLNYLNDLQTGAGLFTGRACFDVTQTNNTATCGNLTSRKAEPLSKTGGRADFTNTITYTQTYTFTPSGTVSNVRFYAVEATAYRGQIIQSITGGNTGNNITAAVTCTVVYKSDLNTKAAGKSTAAALTVDIYAVYNDGATKNGTDRKISITARIKDCACCGAYTTAGTWLSFMCYNLGADSTISSPEQQMAANPSDVYGKYYQWGKKLAWATEGTVSGWANYATPGANDPGYNSDGAAWGYNTTKNSTYDPCPTGFRVPSWAQFKSIANGDSPTSWYNSTSGVTTTSGNVWTWKETTTKGQQIGDFLFLPAAGMRYYTTGYLTVTAGQADYWTNTTANTDGCYLNISGPSVNFISTTRSQGMPIRCVADN